MGKPDWKKASPGKKRPLYWQAEEKWLNIRLQYWQSTFRIPLRINTDISVNAIIRHAYRGQKKTHNSTSNGYGAGSAPGAIPPNAWLVFYVELVNCEVDFELPTSNTTMIRLQRQKTRWELGAARVINSTVEMSMVVGEMEKEGP
ncbi:hypothetical protein RJ639_043022 [Escallonia herrerae]|uniref:peptidylprolyl isomerase n=1 Tax=Escallonia herrerae TaxID=1293975 RepID=A0AA88WF69_9ASTE|nr:hypothetical protein RJ639_043022 [Escallonia herrerae]